MKLKSDGFGAIEAEPTLSSPCAVRATPAECLDYVAEMIVALRAMANDIGSTRLAVLLKLAHDEAQVQRLRAVQTIDQDLESYAKDSAKPLSGYSRSVRKETS